MNLPIQLNSKTICLYGPSYYSDFKLRNYLSNFKKINPFVVGFHCREVFILNFNSELEFSDNDLNSSLKGILGIPSSIDIDINELNYFYIFPRSGTISPWSSKSTDILRNSGIRHLERIERGLIYNFSTNNRTLTREDLRILSSSIRDKMIEDTFFELNEIEFFHSAMSPQSFIKIPILEQGESALQKANIDLGLALNQDEINYIFNNYIRENGEPTDAEIMMFAQANSEHCRHKIFNADWLKNDILSNKSLFQMIKNTYKNNNEGVLSAYLDNAAVLEGFEGERFFPDPNTKEYASHDEPINIVIKVETHNHPTAIAPYPGAATGSGGEIRDEGATGRGAKPKAGLTGFSVSNLRIPGHQESWETEENSPKRIASPLKIMLEAPIGAATFNNEFGRPNLLGYFRSLEVNRDHSSTYGYHKPIMLAGGLGNIRESDVKKSEVPIGSKLIILGGPAMLIGLGGGSASSLSSGSSEDELDYASVQRENAEMERRCQEVLDSCWQRGEENPILFIHDVGAGGLSNALPELIKDSGHGGYIELRSIPSAEPRMSPMEIWCNESQERYVIAVNNNFADDFIDICNRERCPSAIVGRISEGKRLLVYDKLFDNFPVDMSLDILFGNTPSTQRTYKISKKRNKTLIIKNNNLEKLLFKVLRHPSVASKSYLITIGDRTITGLVSRDQMVGPWQIPVADNAVTLAGYKGLSGEAMSIGEKSPLAISNAAASARMAVAESITNIISSGVENISDIKLSANWMGAPDRNSGNEDLYDAVEAIGMQLCPEWNITIPVGKDSLSMATDWSDGKKSHSVISPLSIVISAFCKIKDVSYSITPQLCSDTENTELIFIDLGKGKNRMGGSIAGLVENQVLGEVPDVEVLKEMPKIVSLMSRLIKEEKVVAYHDRSDGGLIVCLAEMAFAGRVGIELNLNTLCKKEIDIQSHLFSEELGFVIQVPINVAEEVIDKFHELGMNDNIHRVGRITLKKSLEIKFDGVIKESWTLNSLLEEWNKVTFWMQNIRDNPLTAEAEYLRDTDQESVGIEPVISFKVPKSIRKPKNKPSIAILREQGVNGHIEMAAAFDRVGFKCIDIHMTDLIDNRQKLAGFKGLVACGGFSYGDVLGAGRGWATTILNNKDLKYQFEEFFNQRETFSLGVCNGCQMMANLSVIIPGAQNWPRFLKNQSEKFESRLVQVEIKESSSIFFRDMSGSIIPVPIAHGEGRLDLTNDSAENFYKDKEVPLQYIQFENSSYPGNPNGSPLGIAALTNKLGNATIMMPHPERAFLSIQHSWAPKEWGEYGPWIKFFKNARDFIG